MTGRLPIWQTSLDSMALLVREAGALIRIAGVTLAAVILLDVVSVLCAVGGFVDVMARFPEMHEAMKRIGFEALDDPVAFQAAMQRFLDPLAPWLSAVNVAQLLALVGTALVCATWCRYLVTGDRPARWWSIRFGAAEIETIGVLVLLVIGHVLAFAVTLVCSTLAAMVWAPAGYALMVVIYVPAFLALMRLTLIVPHVACDGGLDIPAVWLLGRGQTWPIFGILGVVGLAGALLVLLAIAPFVVAGFLHAKADGTMAAIAALGWFANMIATGVALALMLAATCVVYVRLTSVREA